MAETILVVGVGGRFAGQVVPALSQRGAPVRAMIHDPADEPERIDPATLPDNVQALRPMFDHYDRIGLRGNALTLAAILGREPRTLRAYFKELAANAGSSDGI